MFWYRTRHSEIHPSGAPPDTRPVTEKMMVNTKWMQTSLWLRRPQRIERPLSSWSCYYLDHTPVSVQNAWMDWHDPRRVHQSMKNTFIVYSRACSSRIINWTSDTGKQTCNTICNVIYGTISYTISYQIVSGTISGLILYLICDVAAYIGYVT